MKRVIGLLAFLLLPSSLVVAQDKRKKGPPPIQDGKYTVQEMKGGGLDSALRILTNYDTPSQEKIDLVTRAYEVFSEKPEIGFAELVADPKFRSHADALNVKLLGGPMLGRISETGGSVWVRTRGVASVTVRVEGCSTPFGPVTTREETDFAVSIPITGLKPNTEYPYTVWVDDAAVPGAEGVLRTVDSQKTRIVFGSCSHRWGLHYPIFWDRVVSRKPHALLIYGDIAVQDRKTHFGLHRFDYFLRDQSAVWRRTGARLPVYANWDDHDYLSNDAFGMGRGGTDDDRRGLRRVFKTSWNNPAHGFGDEKGGIFFRTRIGSADVLMTDNRYFRGKEGPFLGEGQMKWLEDQLLDCKGPFIVLTCGTLFTDHKAKGKDSWGKYDREGRERLLSFIEKHRIPGVILLSGDWHGARAYTIKRPSGFTFYEFQPASLGGREGGPGNALGLKGGPESRWLFGYSSRYAAGELTFDTQPEDPTATFRLVFEDGTEHYSLTLSRSQLTPPSPKEE